MAINKYDSAGDTLKSTGYHGRASVLKTIEEQIKNRAEFVMLNVDVAAVGCHVYQVSLHVWQYAVNANSQQQPRPAVTWSIKNK